MNNYRGRILVLAAAIALAGTALAGPEPWPDAPVDYHGTALHTVRIGSATAKVLCPTKPEPSRPWVLGAVLYDLENPLVARVGKVQLELAKKGYHVVALSPSLPLGAPDPEGRWDAVYREMTSKYGFSREVALMGISREGLAVVRWAVENPGKVNCLYLDKAVGDIKSWPGGKLGKSKGSEKLWEELRRLYGFKSEAEAMAYQGNPIDLAAQLARDRVAIIYVAGAKDDIVPFSENGAPLQKAYERTGVFFRVLMNGGEGHHPHGTGDPGEIVRLINMNSSPVLPTRQTVAYGPHFSQVLDFWKAESADPTPVVINIHGGGWGTGTRRDVAHVTDYLRAGISVVSVGYRFLDQAMAERIEPPVRAPMYDAARAVQFVRNKAIEWGLDKSRIGLTGGSAGGCTALWLAFHEDLADRRSDDPVARESTRPWCAAVVVPQTSLDPKQMKAWIPNSRYGHNAFGIVKPTSAEAFASFLARREELLPAIAEFSPYGLVTRGAPPVYLYYHSAPAVGLEEKDPTHSAMFGVKLWERMVELGLECELAYPGGSDAKKKSVHEYLIARLSPH